MGAGIQGTEYETVEVREFPATQDMVESQDDHREWSYSLEKGFFGVFHKIRI